MQWLQPQSAACCWLVCLVPLLTDDPRCDKISVAPVSHGNLFSTFEFLRFLFNSQDFIIVLQHGPCRLWISISRMMPRHGWEYWGTPFPGFLQSSRTAVMWGAEWPQRQAPWAASLLRRTLFCPAVQEGLGLKPLWTQFLRQVELCLIKIESCY